VTLQTDDISQERIYAIGSILENSGFSNKQIDDYFLEHYGKKGMQWGVRSNRQRNRELNRRSRAKDRAKNTKEIERARARVKSGKTRNELQRAKNAHAGNKAKLGSREARKILNKAKNKHYEEVTTSQTAKNGKEVARNVLILGGAFAAASVASAILNS
jgi:hypothetical protein